MYGFRSERKLLNKSNKIGIIHRYTESVQFVIDWFGKNAKTYKKDGKLYADVKCNGSALFYWYIQYSECVTIISPQSLIDRVKKEAQRILEKYEKSI